MNNQYNGVNLNKGDQPGQNQQGYNYSQPGQNQQGYNYSQPGQNQQGNNYGQPGQNQQGYNYSQPGQNPQGNNYGQPGQNPQGYNNVPPKAPAGPNVLTFALDYIKGFFSADPMAVLDKAVNEKQHVWSILGGGSVLLVTLAAFGVLRNSVMLVLAMIPGYSYFGYGVDLTAIKVKFFFLSLLVIVGFFFASSGLTALFLSLQKQKADFFQSMNMMAVASLPLAVCGAAAFLISFIYVPLSLLLLIAGVIFKCIMLSEGLKKAVVSGKSSAWYVFGLMGANIVAFSLIAVIMSKMMF